MAEQLPSDQDLREDWIGGPVDANCVIEIRRCFNGVIVRGAPNYSRDTVAGPDDTLVFQATDQFWDWFQHWYETTNQGAKR